MTDLTLPPVQQSPDLFPQAGLGEHIAAIADYVQAQVALMRPAVPLVGLLGKKRAGKDSFAAELVDWHGFRRVAFADPLKATMLDLNPWLEPTPMPGNFAPQRPIRLRLYVETLGWEYAKENPEVRRLLQVHGESIRRHTDPTLWVRTGLVKAEEIRAEGEPVAITDVRYPNEAEAIRAAGGALVRVVRPGLVSEDEHVSETALDDFPTDYTVTNDGTLDDLRHQARAVYESLA